MDIINNLIQLLLLVGIVLLAIAVHEFAHAWTANFLGDDTANYHGRMSLNPMVHYDPVGTSLIVIALFFRIMLGLYIPLFGWGKPVPVNPNRFKNPKSGWALVSFAGPFSNIIMVVFAAIIFHSTGSVVLINILKPFIEINIFLAIFNLLPIPPLDGSKILYSVLPNRVNTEQIEAFGPMVLLVLFFSGGLAYIIIPLVTAVYRLIGLI